jgi:hypothetical protein
MSERSGEAEKDEKTRPEDDADGQPASSETVVLQEHHERVEDQRKERRDKDQKEHFSEPVGQATE